MPSAATQPALTRRGLIVHDSLAFVALLATSIALFGVTLFLFRSFEARRADLATYWAGKGREALAQGHPAEAVADLRVALSYAPEGPNARADQLLLAQGLAQAGHTEEATNYFLNLWDATPGDGFLNLQLARLARQKHDFAEATNYYRASIFGSWQGDGVTRRREVRLELIDFLLLQHLNAEARNELFTLAGNAPNNVNLSLTIATRLEAAGYPSDALPFLERAVAADPNDRATLEHAGRVAYALGDFPEAERFLRRALEERPAPGETEALQQQLSALAEAARRIQELTLTRDQPAGERASHLLTASRIAQARLHACLNATASSARSDPVLDDLTVRWTAAEAGSSASRRTLLENAGAQDAWTELIYATEQGTAQACGQPIGDDALLLRLANAAHPPLPLLAAPLALPPMQPSPTGPVHSFFGRGLFTRKAQAPHGN